MSLISELKRRNVFRVALAVPRRRLGDPAGRQLLFGVLKLPDWTRAWSSGCSMLGFPLALIFSWVYELTPEGLKREHEVDRNESITAATARKLDLVVGACWSWRSGCSHSTASSGRERSAGGADARRTGGRGRAAQARTVPPRSPCCPSST